MANRITEKDLQDLVVEINQLTGSPAAYATDYKANVGHYYISSAYGGHNLMRITSSGGASCTPIGGGYHSKRELHEKLVNFVSGLRAASINTQQE